MKKLLLIAACLVWQFSASAQASNGINKALPPATTQEEYNYATKGLKIQRATGLDMKSGYFISASTSIKTGTYTVVIEDLIRNSNGTVACTILEVVNATWPATQGPTYLCIPNPGSPGEIWGQYWQAQQQYSTLDIMRAVSYSLSMRLSAMTTAAVQK